MKQSPKNKVLSTFPLFIIDTLIPSEKKEKLTKLLCRVKHDRNTRQTPLPASKKRELYPVDTTVTVHHQQYRSDGRVELSIKGVARKKIKPGMLLAPVHCGIEKSKKFWVLPCVKEHIEKGAGGNYHIQSNHFPVAGVDGNQSLRVDIIPLNRVMRISSSRNLFFQSGETVTAFVPGESDEPLQMKWLTGGNLSAEQESRLDRAAASLTCSSPREKIFAVVCAVRGWVPSGNLSPKRDKENIIELGPYWVSRTFIEEIKRFVETRASVEGGIKREDAARELSIPENLLDSFVHYWNKNGNTEALSIQQSLGYIVSKKPGKKAPLAPMTRKLLEDLKQKGSEGMDLSGIRDTRIAEQYQILIRMNLVTVLPGQVLYHPEMYQQLTEQTVKKLKAKGPATIGELKALWGITRKYCMPLLEKMEQDGILIRKGENKFAAGKASG